MTDEKNFDWREAAEAWRLHERRTAMAVAAWPRHMQAAYADLADAEARRTAPGSTYFIKTNTEG